MPTGIESGTTVAGGDDRFQERQWRLQRFGWIVMALVIAAALAGGFGGGPLGTGSAADGRGTQVTYQRIVRAETSTLVMIEAPASAATDGTLGIALGRGYLARIDVDEVRPQPRRVAAAGDGLAYDIAIADAPPAAGAIAVRFRIVPRESGWLAGTVAVADGPPITFRQFVLP